MLLRQLTASKRGLRFLSSYMTSKTVKAAVKQGVIVGRQRALPNGNVFHMYQGIPYAVPPLGELRFKSPVPLDRFEEPELDCTIERAVSFQRDPIPLEVVGSENCLFLNVYAPQTKTNKPLPVMVWIHGGGFSFGNGNSEYFFPQALMEEDVVVVTITYRLGALGFLCLPEAGVWGNAGLKDQRLALQWVQQNIATFNGNPGNVTIFGESAGAASVHLHAYSKHAHNLFHKGIMQSGTANMEWVFQVNPSYKARRLAELLGFSSTNDQEILEFLQSDKVTQEGILTNTMAVLTADERRRGLPLAFRPVVEASSSPDSFVDLPVLEALKQNDTLKNMPLIMGYNSAESIAMVVNAIRKLSQIEQDLERFVPRNLPFKPDDIETKELAAQMRQFYFQGKALSPKLLDNLVELLSDYHFTVDMQHAAELQMRHQPNAPLYFYRFDYIGNRNMYKKIFQLEGLRGACHGDELFYLFQMYNDNSKLTEDDALIVKRFCKLWANFARYGEPTPNGIEKPIIDCNWKAVQRPGSDDEAFSLDFYSIDRQCQMLYDPEYERVQFWKSIYKQFSRSDYSRLSCKL